MNCAHLIKTMLTAMALAICFCAETCAWNVFMAGDSHVCSKIYPNEVEKILTREEADVRFSYCGKIGATFHTYLDTPSLMEEIYDARPDILIVHLGTNDSYTNRFNRKKFRSNLSEFYNRVTERFPECKVVFVTPFYNKLKGASGPNRSTRACADALVAFAKGHGNAYVVDNNATHGMYFLDNHATMMRHDFVHLTVEGYEALGRQVGEALAEMEDLWIIEEPPYIEDETSYIQLPETER